MRATSILLACLSVPTSFGWADEPESTLYTVTLIKVAENRYPETRTKPVDVRFTLDNVVQQNENRRKDDGKEFWHFKPREKRDFKLTCLKDRPLGTSFVLQLDTVHKEGDRCIGTVKVTLRQEKDEVRPAFEMKHGERTRELRRWLQIDGQKHWLTRVFPADGTKSANYVLTFKIASPPRPLPRPTLPRAGG